MPPDAAARLARLFALLAHECRRVDREHRERTRRRRQTDAVASSREARAAAGGRRAERDRTIMAMYRAGYQNARIAAALEVPESTVSRTIATVLADLRRLERARRQQDDE